MVMGRMVYNFTSRARLLGIKAWRFTLYFVLLDIVAFIIQAGGAASASGTNKPENEVLLGEHWGQQPPSNKSALLTCLPGLHIYMAGVGFQQLFVLVFFYIAFRFQQQIKKEQPSRLPQALALLYTQYAALLLITIRIIFRLIEYSKGLDSTIPNHEAYQYIFDTLPMFIALILFNVIHPGRIMPGAESDFPSRKERKNYFNSPNPPQLLLIASRQQGSMNEGIDMKPISHVVPSYGHVQ
ncbi:MAG: hypothetical protein Q9182_007332 [Xanthomendoza sp. 2 TL-2023]